MADPNKIEFEDDIILVIKCFIKKTKRVSNTLWTIYPCLQKVFEKNKKTFGNSLDAINYYLLYGKDEFIKNKEYIAILLNMTH